MLSFTFFFALFAVVIVVVVVVVVVLSSLTFAHSSFFLFFVPLPSSLFHFSVFSLIKCFSSRRLS